MSEPADSMLVRRHGQARRRLFAQSLVNQLTAAWLAALALALAWFLVEPLARPGAPESQRWWVLAGLLAAGTVVAVARTVRAAPTRSAAALELDRRFGLAERVSTAVSLDPVLRATPAGEALVRDASEKLAGLRMGTRFPVRPGRTALLLPAQALGLVLIALFYDPVLPGVTANVETVAARKVAQAEPQAREPIPVKPMERPADQRPNKGEELTDLEEQLRRLIEEANKPEVDPEKARREVRRADDLRRDLEDFTRKQAEKFAALREQLDSMDRLDKQRPLDDGPASDLHDALAKRDLDAAREEVDRLRKKMKDGDLSDDQRRELREQIEEMRERMERLARQEERKKELEELIEQAKSEGRDAESLERELDRLSQEIERSDELGELAKRLGDVQKALQANDLEKAAEEMERLADQLEEWQGELADLEDAEEHLQRLKQLREGLCRRCQGEGEGLGDEPGRGLGAGRGAGERPDNPDALTGSEDERIRAQFDPWGKKIYGGSTTGQAFGKRSTVEMEGEIREAAQSVPGAIEVQKLPRGARDMVREYFEQLGRQK